MMYPFILPDYKGNSIVNLMSSISNSFGKKHKYKQLKSMNSKELKDHKNIVFIVVDGMGYNYLIKQKHSFLYQNLKSKMTSCFLSTTASANTSFLVGYPAQQHALTAWDVNLKEIGAITTVLPFVPMYGGDPLEYSGFEITDILDIPRLHKGFKGKSYLFIDKIIADSCFTTYVGGFMDIVPTSSYNNAFTKLKKFIKKRSTKRRYFHIYIDSLDSKAHREGIFSKEVKEIFEDIDQKVKSLAKSLKGTNTKIIITADHGQLESNPKNILRVENIKGLKECLTIPLAGEERVRDCFVRPSKVKQFESIMKRLSKYCWCYKGEQLIKDNFYGLGKANPKLYDRVGDYVVIMKDKYRLKDWLANSDRTKKPFKGVHGGVSSDEMYVPLITVDC